MCHTVFRIIFPDALPVLALKGFHVCCKTTGKYMLAHAGDPNLILFGGVLVAFLEAFKRPPRSSQERSKDPQDCPNKISKHAQACSWKRRAPARPRTHEKGAASCSKPSDFQPAINKIQNARYYLLLAFGGGARSATAAEGLCLSMLKQALGSAEAYACQGCCRKRNQAKASSGK